MNIMNNNALLSETAQDTFKRHARTSLRMLQRLNRKDRLNILELLRYNGELTVTDVYVRLRIEQPIASQALRDLRQLGLVKTFRYGKHIHYSVHEQRYAEFVRIIGELAES